MSAQNIPYFLRAWQLVINHSSTDYGVTSIGNDTPLKIVFDVETYMLSPWFEARIEIYNLNDQTTNAVTSAPYTNPGPVTNFDDLTLKTPLITGDSVVLSAGYEAVAQGVTFNPSSNRIYHGNIFQSFVTRENVTDYKLNLRCVYGLLQDSLGWNNLVYSDGWTSLDKVNGICTQAQIPKGNIDEDALNSNKAPRGGVIYGRPFDKLREIASNAGLQFWLDANGVNMINPRAFNSATQPTFAYSAPYLPTDGYAAANGGINIPVRQTIIGTPQQTQQGVVFRTFIDGQLKIGHVVQIDQRVLINKFAFVYSQDFPPINVDGIYIVSGIRYHGDTRGQDWYQEITAMTFNFFPSLFTTNPVNVS